ncbi:putative cross-wall-targeting lipoprotein signal [Mizugakiibacter sediminis]|uniref:Putative cross-wall-targeting lipoprotein signal n=1 Tax=Mizugakiibacter sediminis TaxID=1475481 RepID=A0A0K8QPR0_9GAMM|nr:hypothetical protein [Mizugakiibacter sediminis]GAP66656.1 putative cross-wall-targeting lipoprotein signal [Mizugakiibacter sediminis]
MHANTARTPATEHHRWQSPLPHAHAEVVVFDRLGHAMLREMGWRQPPRERFRFLFALLLALLLHIAALIGLRVGMRPHPLPPVPERPPADVIDVRLIEPLPPAPPAEVPPIEVPPAPRIPQRPPRATTPKPPPQAPNTLSATPPPRLFDAQGQPLVPQQPAAAPAPQFQARSFEAPRLMQHDSPVKYAPTRFEQDWAPRDESLLGEAVRKSTLEKRLIKLPGGYAVKCALVPLALAGGCGIAGPEQLSSFKRPEDDRQNLAPAHRLAGPDPKPDARACAEARAAGRPLAGCPTEAPASAASAAPSADDSK